MERIWEKIGYGLWSLFTVNVGTKLVSIGVAIVLWVVVMGSRTVEATKEIPVEIITPPELVPSNEVPDKIAFRLSGPKPLLGTLLDRLYEPIRVNLTGAKPGLVTYRFFSDSIHVPIGVRVLSVNPNAILIKLEPLRRKELPIRPLIVGQPAEGYRITSLKIDPPKVRIKGSESRIEALHEVPTAPIDVSGLSQAFDRTAPVDLSPYNVQLDGPAPKVTVVIEPEAAGPPFRIPHVELQVLTSGPSARLNERSVTILVRADPKLLASLDRKDVHAEIDLRGKPKGRYSSAVKVTLPPGVSFIKVLPEQVGVTLY